MYVEGNRPIDLWGIFFNSYFLMNVQRVALTSFGDIQHLKHANCLTSQSITVRHSTFSVQKLWKLHSSIVLVELEVSISILGKEI